MGGLVAYSDSEEEEERHALPPVCLDDGGSRDEWLSHVYIPGRLRL